MHSNELHLACIEGNKEKVSELLEDETIAINAQDDNKETALHVACRLTSGDDWIVKKLLEKGADHLLSNADGKFAFHIACELGNSDVARAILDHCAPNQHQKENLLTATVNDGVSITWVILLL